MLKVLTLVHTNNKGKIVGYSKPGSNIVKWQVCQLLVRSNNKNKTKRANSTSKN